MRDVILMVSCFLIGCSVGALLMWLWGWHRIGVNMRVIKRGLASWQADQKVSRNTLEAIKGMLDDDDWPVLEDKE